MALKGVPVFGRIKSLPPLGMEPRTGRALEGGIKLTQMLYTGHELTVQLIADRFEISVPTADMWFNELAELLPVEVVREPQPGHRGPAPRRMRLAARPDPKNGGSAA